MSKPLKSKPPGVPSYTLAILAGIPLAAIGVFCCLTIILTPVGVVFLILSGIPLNRVDKRRIMWRIEYKETTRRRKEAYEVYDIEGNVVVPPWK